MHTIIDNIIKNIEPFDNQKVYKSIEFYDIIRVEGLVIENKERTRTTQIVDFLTLSAYGTITKKIHEYVNKIDHTIYFNIKTYNTIINKYHMSETYNYISIVNLYFEKEEHMDYFKSKILIDKLES